MPTPGNPRRDLHRETPRNSSPRPRTSVTDVPSDRPGISHRTRGAKHAPDPARAGKLDGKSASSVTRERPRGPARSSGDLPECLRPRHDPAGPDRPRMPDAECPGGGAGAGYFPRGPIECLMSRVSYEHQIAHLLGNGGPPRLSVSAQLGPVPAELPSTPSDDRLGLDEDQHLVPPRPVAGGPGPEDSIGSSDRRTPGRPLVDAKLVSEGEDLDLHRESGPEEIP
jgi:hypothetical protein